MSNKGRPKAANEAIDELAKLISAEKDDAVDPRLRSHLGRLLRHKKIEKAEFLAGERFTALVDRYRRLMGLPNGNPKPNQLQPRIPGTVEVEVDPDIVQEAKDDYDNIRNAVLAIHGPRGWRMAWSICISNEYTQYSDMQQLRAVLRTIAQKVRL